MENRIYFLFSILFFLIFFFVNVFDLYPVKFPRSVISQAEPR